MAAACARRGSKDSLLLVELSSQLSGVSVCMQLPQ
jgi:hypothetical protein